MESLKYMVLAAAQEFKNVVLTKLASEAWEDKEFARSLLSTAAVEAGVSYEEGVTEVVDLLDLWESMYKKKSNKWADACLTTGAKSLFEYDVRALFVGVAL